MKHYFEKTFKLLNFYKLIYLVSWLPCLLCALTISLVLVSCTEKSGESNIDIVEIDKDEIIIIAQPSNGSILDNLSESTKVGEVGKFTIKQKNKFRPNDEYWLTLEFARCYENPVIIAYPPSYRGGHPTTVHFRNVGQCKAEVQLNEWEYLSTQRKKKGFHKKENLSYLVIEQGKHQLDNGMVMEVGIVENVQQDFKLQTLASFQDLLIEPIVLTQAQTYTSPQAVLTRQRNVTPTGFEVRLQGEEACEILQSAAKGENCPATQNPESVGYIAISLGSVTAQDGKVDAIVGLTNLASPRKIPNSYKVPQGHWPYIRFPSKLTGKKKHLMFLAGLQSFNDSDTAGLRYHNLKNDSVKVLIEEEKSQDRERKHSVEQVGYMAIAGERFLTGTPLKFRTISPQDSDCANVAVGENCSLTVALEHNKEATLKGFGFNLLVDPDVFVLDSNVTVGNLPSGCSVSAVTAYNAIIGICTVGNEFSGDGTLATLNFERTAAGDAVFSVENAKVTLINNETIAVEGESLEIAAP